MSNIRFRSAAHRDFFLEMMSKSKVNDCYHRAFFYVMGIAAETRANINQMFDFKTDSHRMQSARFLCFCFSPISATSFPNCS